jgi:hypothetical protein
MWRAASRAHRNTPVMFTATTLFQSASDSSVVGRRSAIPALLKSTSTRPCRFITSSNAAFTCVSSVTSTL